MLQIAGNNNAPEFKIDYSGNPKTYRNIDHSWIEKSKNLNDGQKAKLKYNYAHPSQGKNYYVQNNPNDKGNIITPNEDAYSEMKMLTVEYRLLGLFRFWNVINYYYPYKYATDRPWQEVLKGLIPEFVNANDTISYHKAVSRMSASINDGHGGIWPFMKFSIAGEYSPPFYFRIIDNKVVVTKILDEAAVKNANIRIGSVIKKINGIPVKKRADALWDYIPAGNRAGKYKELHSLILNSTRSSATYSGYNPDGKKFSSVVGLRKSDLIDEFLELHGMKSKVTSKMITDDIAYVYASNLTYKNMDSIMLPLMKTKAIILDLRNYPSTMPAYEIADYFLDKPMVYSKMTRNDLRYPGLLMYENTNAGSPSETVGKENPSPYQGKLILLVDYRTQSLPEFNCLILRTYKNTVIVGNQTAGADGNVTRTVIPGDYKIKFSGFGIYDSDGGETQRVGIMIDIPVKYTLEDIVKQKDPVLERAIDFAINGK